MSVTGAIDVSPFLATGGEGFRLTDHPTRIPDLYAGGDDARERLARLTRRLAAAQELLYAADSWAVLLIFQAMDAAGKDGAIKHVMSGVNPQGCQVFSFKRPSAAELDHDFLWRTAHALPERGRIGIFNRSWYEEVLVVRVHPKLLAAQRLPGGTGDHPRFWRDRHESIRDHEKHLHRNGTRVVKFFLHLSREEQRERFLSRLDEPEKNWKFELGDVEERAHWDDYQRAYEECIAATHTDDCPWYVVPADDKKNARLIVSSAIVQTLEGLGLEHPRPDPARLAELDEARERLLRGD